MVRASSSTSKFGSAAKAAGLLAATGVAAATTSSVRMAVEFDKAMRNVNSIARLPEKNLQKLQKRVLGLAGKTGQAPKVLAEGLYDLVSSGFDADQSMKILRKSARAASAGLTTTEVSTKAVAAALNAYRMPASKAGKVSDILFRTVDRGVVSFDELSSTIGDVLPFASSLGVKLHEVGAATATMTKAGISAPETMTRLKAIMSGLLKPSEAMGKTLKKQGFESGEALIKAKGLQGALDLLAKSTGGSKEKLAKLFPNVRALGGALALTGENSKIAAGDLKGMEKASGATSRALKEQSKSISFQWDKIKAKATALGIGFGQKLLPQIQRVFDVLNDPKLADGEKLNKLGDMLGDMVRQAIPKIADAAAQAAPKAASAFVGGFLNAGVWGRLALGAFLLNKMGGRPEFLKAGATAGAGVGKGMATGVAASGLKGKLVGLFRSWGPTLGIALALAVGPDLVKKLKEQPVGGKIPASPNSATPGKVTEQAKALAAQSKNLADYRRKLRDAAGEWRAFALKAESPRAREYLNSLADAIDEVRAHAIKPLGRDHADVVKNMRSNWANLRDNTNTTLKDVRQQVRASTTMIKARLGKDTAEGKDAVVRNFHLAKGAIRDAMKDGTISTSKGLAEIRKLMVQELKLYGLSANQARMYIRSSSGDARGSNHTGAGAGHQRGGPINTGAMSGDSVPAMLERGEYVLNRKAVAKVGRGALDRVNFGSAPRFQSGGVVGLGRALQREGFEVGEHPAFGGVTPGVHVPGSYHAKGMAIDVNDDVAPFAPGGGEPGSLDRLYKRLKNLPGVVELLWRVADHFDHLHVAMSGGSGALGMLGAAAPKLKRLLVGGPDSALKGVVQGALDMTRGGAQHRLDDIVASMGGVEGAEGGKASAGGEYGKGALANLWKQAGGPPGAASLMAAIALAESGGNPGAHNPSGASGLWQILGNPFPGNAFDPLTNARMAVAKYKSQGLGAWEAYTNGNYRQYMQTGGLVGMQTGGLFAGSKVAAALTNPMFSGPAGFGIGKALEHVKTGKTAKLRRTAVNKLLRKIGDIGLPKSITDALAKQARDSEVFGDYADRAGNLTDASAIEDALQAELERRQGLGLRFPDADQQKLVESMLARPGGHTQLEWLTEQLGALFKWRNTLIPAEGVATSKRDETVSLIGRSVERLNQVREKIGSESRRRNTLDHQQKHLKKLLDKETGKPAKKRNKGLIKKLREQVKGLGADIRGIDRDQKPRVRVRDALKNRILPGLRGKRDDLNDVRENLLGSLSEVQGAGSSMSVLSTLPPIGELGGTILNVQLSRRDLSDHPPRVVDTDAEKTVDEPAAPQRGAAELAEIARLANLQLTNPDFDLLRYLPQFKSGGIVPGAPHEPQLIVAHGQETVVPAGASVGSAGGGIVLHAEIDLGRGIRERVRLEFDDQGRQSRGAWSAGRAA